MEQHFTLSIEAIISNDAAKVLLFFDICKYFCKKINFSVKNMDTFDILIISSCDFSF